MFGKLYRKFDEFVHICFSFLFSSKSWKHYMHMYRRKRIKIQNLTKEEKCAIKSKWRKNRKKPVICLYATHRLYKSITGKFDVNICPEVLFRTKIEPQMIHKEVRGAWGDKNYFEKFFPNLPFPNTLVRNIYGLFYDKDYNPIDFRTASDIVKNNIPVIIKPSVDSGSSNGVSKILSSESVTKILEEYGENFIVQSVVSPCDEIKKLSVNALPIVRMITLLIDGEPHFASATLRTNTFKEAVADNYVTPDGMGMLTIGIKSNGALREIGHYSNGTSTAELPNGVKLSEVTIPNFEEIKELVLKAQKSMPMFKAIGWDVTVDENYKPLIVEYNLKGMGIYYYQLANGPLFGAYTDKIIEQYL